MSIPENTPVFPVVCIIPSLNPDEKFINTVHGIFAAGFTDLIVVDDGSRESCQHYFEEVSSITGCTVLHHEINRGKGRALKTAFAYYLEHYDQARYIGVVTADADGQHLPEDIRKSAEALIVQCNQDPKKRSFFCMVLGTRDFNEEIVPFKSRNGNKITSFVFQILYGKHIHDTQTGLRAISNDFLVYCGEVPGERFEYEIKMLIDAVSRKVHILEVPIRTVYFNDNRETHFNPIMDSLRIYSVFVRYVLTSLVTWAVDYVSFSVIYLFSDRLLLATAAARFLATLVSFYAQRKFVFEKQKSYTIVFVKYCILVVCSGAISYTLLNFILNHLTASVYILKIAVEGIIYFMNYLVQRKLVWTRPLTNGERGHHL